MTTTDETTSETHDTQSDLLATLLVDVSDRWGPEQMPLHVMADRLSAALSHTGIRLVPDLDEGEAQGVPPLGNLDKVTAAVLEAIMHEDGERDLFLRASSRFYRRMALRLTERFMVIDWPSVVVRVVTTHGAVDQHHAHRTTPTIANNGALTLADRRHGLVAAYASGHWVSADVTADVGAHTTTNAPVEQR